jgi:hypothetical protein
MPFKRLENKQRLIEAYRPMGIAWHPIMFRDEVTDFNEAWIYPAVLPMDSRECVAVMPGNFKRNWWIVHQEIVDEDYYVTVDDDDMYEPNVFNVVKKMKDDIVIISLKRGNHIPKNVEPIRRYPIETLYAHPDNIQIGRLSAQQSFVKGRIFREHLFNDGHTWDGVMAIHHRESGEQIAYRPDLFALFNYYEAGRWDVEPYRVSFGCMINDDHRFGMCLKQSGLNGFKLHVIYDPDSACKGLNRLLEMMEKDGADIGVLVHQDMYFKSLWISQLREQIELLPENWITAGIIGKDLHGHVCGFLHDMRMPMYFKTSHPFPVPASCFDECVIIVNLHKGFRFDEEMPGFDLYGTQAVCRTWEMGGTAWIIYAFAEHYCMRSFDWKPGKNFEDCFKWLHERFPASVAPRIDTTVLGVPKEELPARFDLEFD